MKATPVPVKAALELSRKGPILASPLDLPLTSSEPAQPQNSTNALLGPVL